MMTGYSNETTHSAPVLFDRLYQWRSASFNHFCCPGYQHWDICN